MNYLLDTNILIIYGRETEISRRIEDNYKIFNGENNLAISVVTLGEIDSLTRQFNYGKRRREILKRLIESVFVIDINISGIIEKYGEIDAYSQGKLANTPLNDSAKNMGKNDLWIAATASIYEMNLITTDKDFTHLNPNFLTLNYIDIQDYK